MIYQIIFDDNSTDEATNGLQSWVNDYAETCSDDDLTPNEVKAICYDGYHREIYLSDETVNYVNDCLSGALDDARQAVIDNAIYQQELRRDYYQGQL